MGCFLACDTLADDVESCWLFGNPWSLGSDRDIDGFVLGEVQTAVGRQLTDHHCWALWGHELPTVGGPVETLLDTNASFDLYLLPGSIYPLCFSSFWKPACAGLERPIYALRYRATVSDFIGLQKNIARGQFLGFYLFPRAHLHTWDLMWWGMGRFPKPKQAEDLVLQGVLDVWQWVTL